MPTNRTRRELLMGSAAGALGLTACGVLSRARATSQGESAGSSLDLTRGAYDLDPGVVYLNHAAVGTLPRAVREARARYAKLCESNPAAYVWGGEWEQAVAEVRTALALFLGCAADELAFTRTTTEGFNILAQGLELAPGSEVLYSSLNHAGASRCFEFQAARRGFTVRRFSFPVAETAELSATDVVQIYAEQVRDQTELLVIPHIDNVVGVRYPVRELAERVRTLGVRYVAVDGAQAVGMLPVDVGTLGVDFYATSAHKWLQAPKGTGLLYVGRDVQPRVAPLFVTWGQERWRGSARAYEDFGTRNYADLLALGDALGFQQRIGSETKEAHYRSLRTRARERVEQATRLHWRSPRASDLATGLYAVEIEGVDSREASQSLAGAEGSGGYVVRPFATQGLNTLRVSPNMLTDLRGLDRFFDDLEGLVG